MCMCMCISVCTYIRGKQSHVLAKSSVLAAISFGLSGDFSLSARQTTINHKQQINLES